MEFVLRITIENDATEGDYNLGELIGEVAKKVATYGVVNNRHYNVRDTNGNTVGRFGRYSTPKRNNNLKGE